MLRLYCRSISAGAQLGGQRFSQNLLGMGDSISLIRRYNIEGSSGLFSFCHSAHGPGSGCGLLPAKCVWRRLRQAKCSACPTQGVGNHPPALEVDRGLFALWREVVFKFSLHFFRPLFDHSIFAEMSVDFCLAIGSKTLLFCCESLPAATFVSVHGVAVKRRAHGHNMAPLRTCGQRMPPLSPKPIQRPARG